MRTGATIVMTCLCLMLPAKIWLNHQADRQTAIDSGWQALDESMVATAEVAERVQEKQRSFEYLKQAFERQIRITNRSVAEQIAFEKLSRELKQAQSVWSWFEPRLTHNGEFASLDHLLLKTRQALRNSELERADQYRRDLSQFLAQIRTELSEVPRILALKEETNQYLNALQPLSVAPQQRVEWQQQQAIATQALEDENWTQAFQHWSRLQQEIATHLETQFQAAREHFLEQETRWRQLFGELEPPDLSFLSDPIGEAQEAMARYPEGQEIQAIELFQKASNTLTEWTTEIIRHEQVLEEAKIPGAEYIEELGMRFVKIHGVYWGVTEIRVMDFARWVTEESIVTPTTAKRWVAPGFLQGPTDPAVWITHEDATQCARWIGYMLSVTHFKRKHEGRLPQIEQWQTLLKNGELSDRIPLAMYPDPNQWQSDHFQLYYEDKRLDPRRYLGPVDRGNPSLSGLFGLEAGVWEWTRSQYDYGNRVPFRTSPRKWILSGGGNFGIANYNNLSPSRLEDYEFVLRKDAVGFRVILSLHPNP